MVSDNLVNFFTHFSLKLRTVSNDMDVMESDRNHGMRANSGAQYVSSQAATAHIICYHARTDLGPVKIQTRLDR